MRPLKHFAARSDIVRLPASPAVAAPGGERNSIVAISGVGRAGTTFLVELLTNLGLDTGFKRNNFAIAAVAKAGLEWDPRQAPRAYIVKSPHLCSMVDDVLARGIRLEHVIVPVRDFAEAAASRVRVQREVTGNADGAERTDGGLWGTARADEQEAVLRAKYAELVAALERHAIPATFIKYPRIIRDPAYLYAALRFLLAGIDYGAFLAAFRETARPDWVHSFGAG